MKNLSNIDLLKIKDRPIIEKIIGDIYSYESSTLTFHLNQVSNRVDVIFYKREVELHRIRNVKVNFYENDFSKIESLDIPEIVRESNVESIYIVILNSNGKTSINQSENYITYPEEINLPRGGIITEVNSQRIHTFNSSGVFVIPELPSIKVINILCIAGGGGGGWRTNGWGGGGGAGGYNKSEQINVYEGNYNIIIGAGGAFDEDGTNTSFANEIIVTGGGKGGGANFDGGDGGSGGGAGGGGNIRNGGIGIINQGNDGGKGNMPVTNTLKGGGGGGAGTDGANDDDQAINFGSTGGEGLKCDYSGEEIGYAGGGGGGVYQLHYTWPTNPSVVSDGGGAGGYCPGPDESYEVLAVSGTINTGGGGGGGGNRTKGASGGSGVVIISYPWINQNYPTGGFITVTETHRIHIFYESGTFNNDVNTYAENVDILCVAGGGGGGYNHCGSGAGAGGCIERFDQAISKSIYQIIIGAGGAQGINGNISNIGSLISTTGGGHGVDINSDRHGIDGGSGSGGASGYSFSQGVFNGGNGITGEGFGGGFASFLEVGIQKVYKSGGGGGKANYGGDFYLQSTDTGTNGGLGITNDFSGTDIGYAGGGGGGITADAFSFVTIAGTATHGGGDGGCNTGTNSTTATDGLPGTINTGGGGGGSGWNRNGGQGGSGIVIIRYAFPFKNKKQKLKTNKLIFQ